MNSAFSIAPSPQQFAFFFTAAFIVAAVLLACQGWRKRWPLLPWLTIMLWGVTFGFVGSKLMLIPVGGWLAGLANFHLPATADKTLLGGLIGGIFGIELSRRWLRFNQPVADAYALVLPLATAIGRIGCLLGGCCFGTPTNLPWAVSYGPGSSALEAHLARELLAPGALRSLPVHPLQGYDIVLMLGLTLLLLKARRHLKRSGSLLALYLAAYGVIRFGEEFIREGGSSVAGLKYVQWGLLLGVAIALAVLVTRERASLCRPMAAAKPAGGVRAALALAAVLAVIVAGYGWFTPLEITIIGLHLVPLTIAALAAFVPARWRGFLGRSAATLAAGAALLVSGDSIAGKNPGTHSYYSLYAAGTRGAYTEICGSHYRFTTGGVGVSRTNVRNPEDRTEYGIRGYLGSRDWNYWNEYGEPGHTSQLLYTINPYFLLETRWVGAGVGVHAGNHPFSTGWDGRLTVLPQAHLRLGKRRGVFVEGGFADNILGGLPQPLVRLGVGHEYEDGSSILIGAAYTGIFAESNLKVGSRIDLTPYASLLPPFGQDLDYQVGLALRWRLP